MSFLPPPTHLHPSVLKALLTKGQNETAWLGSISDAVRGWASKSLVSVDFLESDHQAPGRPRWGSIDNNSSDLVKPPEGSSLQQDLDFADFSLKKTFVLIRTAKHLSIQIVDIEKHFRDFKADYESLLKWQTTNAMMMGSPVTSPPVPLTFRALQNDKNRIAGLVEKATGNHRLQNLPQNTIDAVLVTGGCDLYPFLTIEIASSVVCLNVQDNDSASIQLERAGGRVIEISRVSRSRIALVESRSLLQSPVKKRDSVNRPNFLAVLNKSSEHIIETVISSRNGQRVSDPNDVRVKYATLPKLVQQLSKNPALEAEIKFVSILQQDLVDNKRNSTIANIYALFLKTDPRVIAEQQALLDFEIYNRIQPIEILGYTSRNRSSIDDVHSLVYEDQSFGSVSALLNRFNFLVSYVTSLIVQGSTVKARSDMIFLFVRVAKV
ncbi:UNVERIFIED_CONTAM: hypothetical protein HDU68_000142 [Siphonaria sp. JEL0065]|nr:hypothetical protein HDU68_000142 [Siphonaria sp. JEL0065]